LWAPVVEAPLYEVSTWGRARRGAFDVAFWSNKKGYHLVSLEIAGVPRLRYVHRLVLAAFAGPGYGLQANHDDGVKGHNALDNLAWATPSANVAHAWARGLMRRRRRLVCRYGRTRSAGRRPRPRRRRRRPSARPAAARAARRRWRPRRLEVGVVGRDPDGEQDQVTFPRHAVRHRRAGRAPAPGTAPPLGAGQPPVPPLHRWPRESVTGSIALPPLSTVLGLVSQGWYDQF
jgi:hypothetical protein